MNNISDPNATEMRGWVMLMLQRAAENVNPSECNDPAVLLACALSSDSCPAACTDKNEKDTQDQNPNNAFNGVVAGDLKSILKSNTIFIKCHIKSSMANPYKIRLITTNTLALLIAFMLIFQNAQHIVSHLTTSNHLITINTLLNN